MDDRTLKEIIREELKKLSKLSWGQRVGYVWDYYKPLLAAILGIIMVISIGVTIYRNLQLNQLLQVYFVNCNALEVDGEQIAAEFGEYIGGIGDHDVISIDTSIYVSENDNSQYGVANQMKLVTMAAAKAMDLMLVDEEEYLKLAEQGYFADLSDYLSEDQLEEWSDLLVEGPETEDGTIPISALDLTEAPLITEKNVYAGNKVYGAVMANAVHTDLCDDFFSYLFQK